MRRNLAALTWLRALRDLDLQLVRRCGVLGRHTKTRGSNLLDLEFRSSRNRSVFSPPSPEFARAPSRFRAIAIVSCASADSAPCDMAPPENRRTICSTAPPHRAEPDRRRNELQQIPRLERLTLVDKRRESFVEIETRVSRRGSKRMRLRDCRLQRSDDLGVGRVASPPFRNW
jgi:hypothetical protein